MAGTALPRKGDTWQATQLDHPLQEVIMQLFYFLPRGGGYDETFDPDGE